MSLRHFLSLFLFLAILLGCGEGCGPSKPTSLPARPASPMAPQTTSARILVDAVGHRLRLGKTPHRIVSCAPSITEILYSLGLQNALVLDTTACDYPPDAKNKPHFNALSTDIEPILAQNPDLVIDIKDLNHALIGPLDKAEVPQLTVDVSDLPHTLQSILWIGEATGKTQEALSLVQKLRAKLDAIQQITARASHKPRVCILYGTNPLYTTGPNSFINDLISVAGGINIVDKPPPGNVISAEEVVARQPEVILCAPELVPLVRRMPGWAQSVPAVRNGRFYTQIDALERPGPRMADAAEALARYLHPNLMRGFPLQPPGSASQAPPFASHPRREGGATF